MNGTAGDICKILANEYAAECAAHTLGKAEAERKGCHKVVASLMMLVTVFPIEPFMFTIGAPLWVHLMFASFFLLGMLLFGVSASPPKHAPAQSISYLERMACYLEATRELERSFPQMPLVVDPAEPLWEGQHGGRKWSLAIREADVQMVRHDNLATVPDRDPFTGKHRGSTREVRVFRTVRLWRVEWVLAIDGAVSVESEPPTEHVTVVGCDYDEGQTKLTFSLPKNHSEREGLGHAGRTFDFQSQPGQHHPEFVGEEVGRSLAWALRQVGTLDPPT